MQAFTLTQPKDMASAITAAAQPGAKYIAGGTDLLQLAKDNVETPSRLVDLEVLTAHGIHPDGNRLRLEPLARMSDVAAHPEVAKNWPVLSQALLASASPQIRNMATMGGNLLQRTRCGYFRDTGFGCNKRNPGSGCPAINGENRMHAILGGSDHCIATYPGDMAVAMRVLDATVETVKPDGTTRAIPIADFHRLPGDTPERDNNLARGELITAVTLPRPIGGTHIYRKVRDRASYAFALVSVAAVIQKDGSGRAAFGGVAHKPWRVEAAESMMPQGAKAVATQVFADAKPTQDSAFKVPLAMRTLASALSEAKAS